MSSTTASSSSSSVLFSGGSEASHLKKQLRSALRTRGSALLSAVHEVLVALSAGVDVASVYAEMLQAIEIETNRDVRATRLVYLYLTAVQAPAPDFALLLVNSLHKHARNASPVLRHEAVRTLVAVVAPTDYRQFVAPVLSRALDDSHPLVRRGATLAALLAALRLPLDDAARADLRAALLALVDDRDESVALAALLALSQLLSAHEFVPSHAALLRLLAAATTAPPFARAYVAELVLRVPHCSDEHRVELLNALDVQLEHADACVVASAAAAMLHLCRDTPLLPSVCRRLIAPLSLLVAHPANSASLFVALRHLALVLPHAPDAAVDLAPLYVRYTDEPFVQIEKARFLAVAATAATTPTCVELIGAALRLVEAAPVVDALLDALVQIARKPTQRAEAVADIGARLRRACLVGGAANRNVAVIRCAELVRARPELADEATLGAMTEYLLSLNRDALCALLDAIASVGPVLADGAALLSDVLARLANEPALAHDSELVVRLLQATMRCFADDGGGAPYSRAAIDTLQLCLASDDARVRQSAELFGAVMTQGKSELRAAVQEPVGAAQSRREAATLSDFYRGDAFAEQ